MSMQGFIKPEKQVYFGAFRLPLTPNQKVVLLFIIGKVYEWIETRATMQATLSLSYISNGTNIDPSHVNKALKALRQKGYITIAKNAIRDKGCIITLLSNFAMAHNAIPTMAHNAIPNKSKKNSQNLININPSTINKGMAHNASKQEHIYKETRQEQEVPLPLPTGNEIASSVVVPKNVSVKKPINLINPISVIAYSPIEIASVVAYKNRYKKSGSSSTSVDPSSKSAFVCCSLKNNVQEKAVSHVPVPVTPPVEIASVCCFKENNIQEEAVNVPISPIACPFKSTPVVVPVVNQSIEATKEESPYNLSSDCKSIGSILSSMGFGKVTEECSAPSPYSAAPLPIQNAPVNVYKPQNELNSKMSIDRPLAGKVVSSPSGVNPIDCNKLYNLFVDNTKNDNILIHRGSFNKTVNMYLSKIENIEEAILEIANQMKTRKTNDNWTNFLTLCYEKSINAISVSSSDNASICPVIELKTQESKSITIAEKVAINASSGNSAPLPKPIPSIPAAAGKQDIITLIKSSLPVSDSAIYAGIDILEKRNSIDLLADIKEIIASQKKENGKVNDHTRYFVSLCQKHSLVQPGQKATPSTSQAQEIDNLEFRIDFMRNLRIKYDNKEINAVIRANGKEDTIRRINGWIIETYEGTDINMKKIPLELLDMKYFTKELYMKDMSPEEKSKMFAQLWAILDKKKV